VSEAARAKMSAGVPPWAEEGWGMAQESKESMPFFALEN
jgi:hypothetical protein